jgi:cytochrome P450
MAAHKESANDLKPYSHAPFHAASFVIAESLGNFQHNPEHTPRILRGLEETCTYFQEAVRAHQQHPRDDLISALLTVEHDFQAHKQPGSPATYVN